MRFRVISYVICVVTVLTLLIADHVLIINLSSRVQALEQQVKSYSDQNSKSNWVQANPYYFTPDEKAKVKSWEAK